MFNRIVIAVDAETRGRDAVALATQIADENASLVLAHVHPGYLLTAKGDNGAFEVVESADAQRLLASVQAESGLQAECRTIGASSVGAALHCLAEEVGADLLVVGSNRRGMLGRVLVGNGTLAALNGAPCAVAVAVAGYADDHGPIQKIGVAFDGSDESAVAFTLARELATAWDAGLSACTVVPLPVFGTVVSNRESVESARRRMADLGAEIECSTAVGDPAEELGIYSGTVDLLVVGARSCGPFGRLLHGSTAHRLLRTARTALLVLPRGARVTHQADASEAEATHA